MHKTLHKDLSQRWRRIVLIAKGDMGQCGAWYLAKDNCALSLPPSFRTTIWLRLSTGQLIYIIFAISIQIERRLTLVVDTRQLGMCGGCEIKSRFHPAEPHS